MNDDLSQRLYAAFPYLYRGHSKPPTETAICWGFECGDSWYLLLWDLSEKLTHHLQTRPDLAFEVTQVKSKFGTLRYRVRGGDDVTDSLIAAACERAIIAREYPEVELQIFLAAPRPT